MRSMNTQPIPTSCVLTVLISLLLGLVVACLFAVIAAFLGQDGQAANALFAMPFLLTVPVVVCTGFLLTQINRARGEVLERLDHRTSGR